MRTNRFFHWSTAMTLVDLKALSPFCIIGAAAVIVLLVASVWRNRLFTLIATSAGTIAALAAVIFAAIPAVPIDVLVLFRVDGFGLFFICLVLLSSLMVALLSYGYFRAKNVLFEEFFVFLLLATLGAMALTVSIHFTSFFIGLEVLSISLYSMIAYLRTDGRGTEAGIKYLVQASVSTSFLLFGMALIYADIGVMDFSKISLACGPGGPASMLSSIGLSLIIVGIGFKLALVPFHLWAPDVYQGAPAPVTAFIAAISKTAMLALLMRFFHSFEGHPGLVVKVILWTAAIASMFIGNILALLQENVKRIIAYSSIAHMGYFLAGFLCASALGAFSASFYITVYVITTLCALSVVTLLSEKDEKQMIADFRGLAFTRPVPALAMTVSLLSFAGIPLTAGFMGKFYVVAAGVHSGKVWPLLISLIIGSVFGLFYYLRVIFAMYQRPLPQSTQETKENSLSRAAFSQSWTVHLVVWTTAILILFIGICPGPLFDVVKTMVVK
jgi:NADH-quinone oxidoreductase subunit N